MTYLIRRINHINHEWSGLYVCLFFFGGGGGVVGWSILKRLSCSKFTKNLQKMSKAKVTG